MATETSKIRNTTSSPTPMYDALPLHEQATIMDIYRKRELQDDFPEQLTDRESRLEFLAHEYHNQIQSFKDVLTKKGFEPVSDAPFDYKGQIAGLSQWGTVIMLGKPQICKDRRCGRATTSSRIYRPDLTLKGELSTILEDPRLGRRLRLSVYGHPNMPGYTSSALRGLAINPKGLDDDELAQQHKTVIEMTKTCFGMGQKTMESLLRPREKQKQK